jgi:EpsI family protein
LLRYRLLIVNLVLSFTLAGSYWGRRVENAQVSQADFLKPLNMPFKAWKTSDASLTASELDLLKPDATLVRRYTGPNKEMVEIAVIAGHRKQSVHTPGFCMVGGGWEITSQEAHTLALPGRKVEATRSVMTNKGQQLVATYFFTDGEFSTRNILEFQGSQLLKRFQREVPIGALVRVIVPVQRTQADAEKLSDEFAQATVPSVLAALHSVHLETK